MKLLREPLVHFLFAGAALFGIYAWVGGDRPSVGADESRIVRVTAADLAWLKQTWSRQWGREPAQEDLETLLAEYLREQLLYREARAMGLDENDTVVRRRLAQKMDFLAEDEARSAEPTQEDLRQLYSTQRDRFRHAGQVSFEHIYFSEDRRGGRAEDDARRCLSELSRTGAGEVDKTRFGDRFLLGDRFENQDLAAVESQFGREFAEAVFQAEPGRWTGPTASGYGIHVVSVHRRVPGRLQNFDEAREDLLAMWRAQREQESKARILESLLGKYDVRIDESLKPLMPSVALNDRSTR